MSTIHYTHCPLCKSDNVYLLFDVKDYTVTGSTFPLFHCNDCSVRFTQDVPSVDNIGSYYKSENYISHTNSNKGLINNLYQCVRTRTMKQKASIIKKYTGCEIGELLDIGCGTGTFLNTMQTKGWNVTGLEPDADARHMAQKVYNIETRPSHELFSLPHQKFNAITLWHVLEHVHSLHEYMHQMKQLLATNGLIFIAVPNYTSKDAKSYGKYWAGYDVPRHLYHFSPTAMHKLAELHGLKIIKMLPMWFDSFYVDMLSSKYKTGSVKYLSAALHGLASNINALGNVEACCSIIYIVSMM